MAKVVFGILLLVMSGLHVFIFEYDPFLFNIELLNVIAFTFFTFGVISLVSGMYSLRSENKMNSTVAMLNTMTVFALFIGAALYYLDNADNLYAFELSDLKYLSIGLIPYVSYPFLYVFAKLSRSGQW